MSCLVSDIGFLLDQNIGLALAAENTSIYSYLSEEMGLPSRVSSQMLWFCATREIRRTPHRRHSGKTDRPTCANGRFLALARSRRCSAGRPTDGPAVVGE